MGKFNLGDKVRITYPESDKCQWQEGWEYEGKIYIINTGSTAEIEAITIDQEGNSINHIQLGDSGIYYSFGDDWLESVE